MTGNSQSKVVGKECRFVIFIQEKHNVRPDLHLVKETLHYEDGTTKPNIKLIKNFQRPFYLTLPSKRNHKDKKEWEHISNLAEHRCTQSELRNKIATALDMSYSSATIGELSLSPYLYGSDITSASLIKKIYKEKYPEYKTPFSVGFLDIETRPNKDGAQDLIMLTILHKDKLYTYILKSIVNKIPDYSLKLDEAMDKYLPQYTGKLDCKLITCNDPVDIIRKSFKQLNEWSPDFLAIWNMDFDINVVLKTLSAAKLDPADILSHPSIPREARYCRYIQGKTKKVTASGKVTPISPASRWHTLILTSSFYVIDAMCVYKQLRISQPEEPKYDLNTILTKELGTRKLSFEEANHVKGINWHLFMQDNYPIEYIVYNRYDVLSMQELDHKTKDLSYKIQEFAGITSFDKFNSQPKKIADAVYCKLEKEELILGTVGKEPNTDQEEGSEDNLTHLGLKGWILTLPANMQVNGLKLIKENEHMNTNIRCMVADSDAVSAYPTTICVLNVSKETTERELIDIEEIPKQTFMSQNINIMSGSINALEYCTTMFNLPSLIELHKEYVCVKNKTN